MRKALWFSLFFGIAMPCFAFGCKTKSNDVTRRVTPTGGKARIPVEWDGLTDWSENTYTLGEAP